MGALPNNESHMKFGHREGPGKGREIGVAASQYFHRRGGHFVYINTSGDANLCGSLPSGGYNGDTAASSVYGWLVSPKDAAGYNSWKSNTTAGNDDAFVIYGLDDVFEMPVDDTTTASLSYVGRGACIDLAGADATYNRVQYALYKATAASTCFTIVDVGATSVYVKIRTDAKQQ